LKFLEELLEELFLPFMFGSMPPRLVFYVFCHPPSSGP
jgi:hypothetical protein